MSKPSLPSQPRRKEDALMISLDRLRQNFAADVPGHEQEWTATVDEALAGVETALRQHRALAKAPGGLLAEVDETRPTLARQAEELCSGHGDLLKQVLELREEVQHAAEAFKPAAD